MRMKLRGGVLISNAASNAVSVIVMTLGDDVIINTIVDLPILTLYMTVINSQWSYRSHASWAMLSYGDLAIFSPEFGVSNFGHFYMGIDYKKSAIFANFEKFRNFNFKLMEFSLT